MLFTFHTVPVDQYLFFLFHLICSIAHLHAVAMRILEAGNEEFGGSCNMGIMAKRELEETALDVEGETQGLARDGAGIGTHDGFGGAPAGIDVLWVVLLVAREDREVLVVPQVAACIGVIGGVVPERTVQQGGFDGLEAAV